ncbi:MAG: cytochrome c [Ignavibacteriota bacterium]|nr:cytochrome c [Ignavibacteriota bacterium]
MKITLLITFITVLLISISGCSKEDKGIGMIKEVKLGEIDKSMVTEGQALFQKKCSTCHRMDEKLIGSALRGITKRRTPEWIMNMILNPDGMIKENKEARELFEKLKVRMAPQNMNEDEARKILEYLRTVN